MKTIDEAIAHAREVAKEKRNENFTFGIEKCKQCADEHEQLAEWLEELKEYKDAEEKGLLLRLPCKVGTYIYMINRYWIDEGHICGIAEADDIDCFCYKVYCDPDDYTMVAAADFNETWFLSRKEAEQALKQMGE